MTATMPHEATPGSPRHEDRHRSPYSTREKVGRLLWAMVQATLFRGSFHTWYRWRNALLRRFGATIHPTCAIRRTVKIECPWNLTMGANSSIGDSAIIYCLGPVTMGERVTISQYAHVCAGTHDYSRPDLPLIRPPITIEDDVWIATEAFVGPNVTVGAGAILGARGCAFKKLKPWTIYGGNPAQAMKMRPQLDRSSGADA